MRIVNRRYRRDIARYTLATEMVRLGARTRTIRQWTGLSGKLVRALYSSYLREEAPKGAVRPRGPPPRQASSFLRTSKLRGEAAALAGLCGHLNLIPSRPVANAHLEIPGIERGERLCRAFELYQSLVGHTDLTLDHAVQLILALAQGTELRLRQCAHCGGAMIVDPQGPQQRVCTYCSNERVREEPEDARTMAPSRARKRPDQQTLF